MAVTHSLDHQPSFILSLVVVVLLAAILAWYRRATSPLGRIPAIHPLASITSLYMLYLRYRGIENQSVYLAHQRLGPVVKLGPDKLSINCVDDGIRTVYQNPEFEKTSFYSMFENFGSSHPKTQCCHSTDRVQPA